MSADLPFQTLTELSRRLAAGELTSRRIVAACLARIDALDGRLHAFVDVYRDDALRLAEAADLERAAGFVRGPLHGLPIALKDLLHVAGRQTTAGSKSWLGRTSDHTATVVERLLAAGMIPLGKTHMVEFAFGGWGRNQPMGAPWNPWDTARHRVTGGSSSGSAAAVAAGLVPAALGSDTGGSIRIPAALCGLTGLKPTYGLVSLDGAVPLSTTLDSLGPIVRSVDDAALVTAAIAGPDPRDPATLHQPRFAPGPAAEGGESLAGLRVATLRDDALGDGVLPEIRAALATTLALLRDLGAVVEEVRFPLDFAALMVDNGRLIAAEAWALHRAYIEDPSLPIDPWVRKRVISGKDVSAADYLALRDAQRRAAATFAEWMRGRAALLTPTLPIDATPLDDVDEATTPLATFTRAANFLATCALSVPAGYTAAKLPIGMQLIGAPFGEAAVIRIGRALQQRTRWHLARPDLSAWAGG